MVGPESFELSTFRLATRRSIRLSYGPQKADGPHREVGIRSTTKAAYRLHIISGCQLLEEGAPSDAFNSTPTRQVTFVTSVRNFHYLPVEILLTRCHLSTQNGSGMLSGSLTVAFCFSVTSCFSICCKKLVNMGCTSKRRLYRNVYSFR